MADTPRPETHGSAKAAPAALTHCEPGVPPQDLPYAEHLLA